MPQSTRIPITPSEHVTAIPYPPASRTDGQARIILTHGAGGNQASPFMVQFATALAARGIGTLTFNFLYSENGRRLPDRGDKLEACYRAVIRAVQDGTFDKSLGQGPLIIGGKSMGGRIASQVAAGGPGTGADAVAGLLFLGYPLHPPGRPEVPRTKHLPAIRAPMLFVQGSRDAFGTPEELRPVIRGSRRRPISASSRAAITPGRCRNRPAGRRPTCSMSRSMRSRAGWRNGSWASGRAAVAAGPKPAGGVWP
jgi:uncharacterized protein